MIERYWEGVHMSRIHSSKKGRSGSKTPYRNSVPDWVKLKGKDAEEKLIDMIRQGYTMSHAGVILRDVYGIPKIRVVTGKKMLRILRQNNMEQKIPEDLMSLMKRAVRLNKHLQKNPNDLSNMRGLRLVESKINRLIRYYKRIGRLPEDWKYSIDTAELLTKST
ncbi:MAG: 30S ribosomal protein S15 [Thermoplasmata archaeon]